MKSKTAPRTKRPAAVPPRHVARYRFDPARLAFHRIEGEAPALPDALRIAPPRRPSIFAPLVLAYEHGNVVTGLRKISPGVFRGDILRPDGDRSLLLLHRWQNVDKETFIEVHHFFSTAPGLSFKRVNGLAQKVL